MEDVLEIYQRPEDATNPIVCVDGTSKQHIKETRQPLPIVEGFPFGAAPIGLYGATTGSK